MSTISMRSSLIVSTFGNPVLDVEMVNSKNSVLSLVGNMFAEALILKSLKLRSSYGFNIYQLRLVSLFSQVLP